MTSEVKMPVAAYVTNDEEGSPAMLFFDKDEAAKYTDETDPPQALVLQSDALAAIEAARVEAKKLRADILAVRAAGAILSNCAFNLAQRNPGQFTARDIMALDDARKRWDEVLRSLAKEAP